MDEFDAAKRVINWDRINDHHDKCEVGVDRAGEFEPCDKPAVGLGWCWNDYDGTFDATPLCVFHLRKDNAIELEEFISYGFGVVDFGVVEVSCG